MMNMRIGFAGLALVLTSIAGTLLWTGCEADTSTKKVVISPQSAVVRRGQSVKFTASGGYDYNWSLDPDDGSGTLNTHRGSTVIYTCMSMDIGTMPKRIRVTSTIEGASSDGGSNSVPYSVEGVAEIYYPNGYAGDEDADGTSTNST